MVLTQLSVWSLPLPEVCSSNPLFCKKNHQHVEKTKINKKRPGIGPLKKLNWKVTTLVLCTTESLKNKSKSLWPKCLLLNGLNFSNTLSRKPLILFVMACHSKNYLLLTPLPFENLFTRHFCKDTLKQLKRCHQPSLKSLQVPQLQILN